MDKCTTIYYIQLRNYNHLQLQNKSAVDNLHMWRTLDYYSEGLKVRVHNVTAVCDSSSVYPDHQRYHRWM